MKNSMNKEYNTTVTPIVDFVRKRRVTLLALSAIIVFVTSYMLILPALTLDEEEAASQGGIDLQTEQQIAAEQQEQVESEQAEPQEQTGQELQNEGPQEQMPGGTLTCEGTDFSVQTVFDSEAGLPENTQLVAEEIPESDENYAAWCDEALKALHEAGEGESIESLEFARFYDISLCADEQQIEPEAAVNVSISYKKAIPVADEEHLRIVHFAVDEEGQLQPEVLEEENVVLSMKKGKLQEAAFEADSFSVYGIVYTVDFHHEADGQTYDYSIEGESAISLKALVKELHMAEDADAFMSEVRNVEFTDPELLRACRVEDDMTTLWDVKLANHFLQPSDLWRPEKEVRKNNEQPVQAGDWVLVSLQPFDTEETLTITMNNGDRTELKVTDAQDAPMKDDGVTVDSITNPAGTTFDVFNYWVDDDLKDEFARLAWPGFDKPGTDANLKWDQPLRGTGGNNAGINASTGDAAHGHALKFSPAFSHTVYDGTINNWTQETSDNYGGATPTTGLNSYTLNADPRQGIVAPTLSNGYPKLSGNGALGCTNESLQYLFDPAASHAGKASYSGADRLLYVDREGYYTYDSRDYKADFDTSSKEFTLTEQTASNTEERGFWPFGTQHYWVGMHMNAQFSIPTGGQVLNPRGEMKDMQFEFSGDDDTWIYIDGVLVGDGGGIHNRTEIDINFRTGRVLVTGTKDPNHMGGTLEQTLWLDDIFRAAGKYDAEEWDGHTFKEGTYHTFDMFYLERGGGESNLYIHYNLVSTADFTGHKAYIGGGESHVLFRDQFQFEMIGLDEDREAIMPIGGDENGAGTVASPKKVHTDKAWGSEEDGYLAGTVYTTGVTEDGNINFGTAEITQEEMRNCDQGHPSTFKYIIREVIPGDAVNEEGIRWDQATEEQKASGGFTKDQVVYDSTVYYMLATVTSWDQLGPDGNTYKHYGLSKTYYTDDTFTTQKDGVTFVDFRNTYQPAFGNVGFDKVDAGGRAVPDARFALFTGKGCKEIAKDADGRELTEVSDADGKVWFEDVPTGTYYMKETQAPEGYTINNTVYKVTVTDSKDKTRSSRIVVLGDKTQNPVTEIVNTKPGELSVVKRWVDKDGNEVDGGNASATVQLRRYHYEAQQSEVESHNVTVRYTAPINWGQSATMEKTWSIEGDSAVISWELSGGADKSVFSGYDSFEYTDHPKWSIERSGIHSDITVNVTLDPGAYWVVANYGFGIDDIEVEGVQAETIPDELVPDTSFPADSDSEATVTLSASNNWANTWTIGDDPRCDFPATDGRQHYLYYAVELDEEGNEVSPGEDVSEGVKLVGIEYDPEKTEDAGITEGLITVINETEVPETEYGYELPAAGGSGTTWIYLLGTILLLGCGVTLIARRHTRATMHLE